MNSIKENIFIKNSQYGKISPKDTSMSLKTQYKTNNISECRKVQFPTNNNEKVIFKGDYPMISEEFELKEYIGRGSSGIVYKGILKKNRNPFAIKIFTNEKQREKKEEKEKDKRQLQEISVSKKLHHKNIILLYAFFQNEKNDYSVQELAKYGDMIYFLKNLLKRQVFSETALDYFAKQILEGLAYLHRLKTVHLDIKPDNILINSALEAKIIDFSVACSYSKYNPEDLVKFPFVGTGKFMSPEIIDRTHMRVKEAEKLDIYSFGVTLYYLFYGEYPYKLNDVKSNDYPNILKNIKNQKLEFPKGRTISEKFKDILNRMLEKDYRKRITINEALNHPWIQGSKFIFDEKENSNCLESFLINLITDNIKKFNDYIN